MPSERAQLTAFYTYEKVAETNQWVTLTSGALNNLLRYAPWDKGNTFGVNGVFHLVPEKWTLSVLVQQQDVDGFLDITAREAGRVLHAGPHDADSVRPGWRSGHRRLRRHEADDGRGGSRLRAREGRGRSASATRTTSTPPRTRSPTGRRSSRRRFCSSSRPTTATRNRRKFRGLLFIAIMTPCGRAAPSMLEEISRPSVASAPPRITATSRE